MQKRRKRIPTKLLLRHPLESASFKAYRKEKFGGQYQIVLKAKTKT